LKSSRHFKKSVDFSRAVYFHFTNITWRHWFDRSVLPDYLSRYFKW